MKAVDIGIFLGYVTTFPAGPAPDMTPTTSIDLETDLPRYRAPDVRDTIPEGVALIYIQGLPVERASG